MAVVYSESVDTRNDLPSILDIEVIPFSIPFSVFLNSGSSIHIKKATNVLVRVIAEDGLVGISEASAIPEIIGESQASIMYAIKEWILPRLKGLRVNEFRTISKLLGQIDNNFSAKAAVDMAVHDACAKAFGTPMYKYLGGSTNKIALTWIVGQRDTPGMIDEALEAKNEGYRSYKIKIGIDPKKDVDVIFAMRKQLGDDIRLYVDANQAYSYYDAIWALPRMIEAGIVLAEDPLPNWNIGARKMLSQHVSLPFLADECVKTPTELMREVELGIIRLINIKPPRSGYHGTREIVNLAASAGLEVIMGTLLESDLGVLGCSHFCAASAAADQPAELTYWRKMHHSVLSEELEVKDGVLTLPDTPGIGIDVDLERVASVSDNIS